MTEASDTSPQLSSRNALLHDHGHPDPRSPDAARYAVDRITPPVARLPRDLLRHEILLQHGDAPDAFLALILDWVFLPLVTAAPGQQKPQRPPVAPAGRR